MKTYYLTISGRDYSYNQHIGTMSVTDSIEQFNKSLSIALTEHFCCPVDVNVDSSFLRKLRHKLETEGDVIRALNISYRDEGYDYEEVIILQSTNIY